MDLSKNKLKDLAPLSSLTQLLWLKVDRNLLTSASMQELPYLQVISFDRNRIMDFEGITHPLLTNLSLKGDTGYLCLVGTLSWKGGINFLVSSSSGTQKIKSRQCWA